MKSLNVTPYWEGLWRWLMNVKATDPKQYEIFKGHKEWQKLEAMASKEKWEEK